MTPIATRLADRLRDRRSFYSDWLAQWQETKSQPGAKIDLFNGREAAIAGFEFSGSSRDIFWDAIVRGVRKDVIAEFAIVEQEARSYGRRTALDSIDQSVGALVGFVRVVRRLATKKDSVLRGDGFNFPPESDEGHWEDLTDQAIARMGDALKSALIEQFENREAMPPNASAGAAKLTRPDIAQRQILFALLVENRIRPSALHDLRELASEHSIAIDPAWIDSSLSPWMNLDWFTTSRPLKGHMRAALKPTHYVDALRVVMDWIGANELMIDGKKEEVVADIPPHADIPLRAGWKWMSFGPEVPPVGQEDERRLVLLDGKDSELAGIRQNLQQVVERVRGDNELENREAVLASLSQANNLLSRSQLAYLQLKVGVIMALDDAVSMAANWPHKMLLETIRASVANLVRRVL